MGGCLMRCGLLLCLAVYITDCELQVTSVKTSVVPSTGSYANRSASPLDSRTEGLSQCDLSCKVHRGGLSFFSVGDVSIPKTYIFCDVLSDEDKCAIAVEDLLCKSDCSYKTQFTLYPRLTCKGDFDVVFQNPTGFKFDIISYLHMINCSVDFENTGVFGKAADLLVLVLEDWKTHEGDEVNTTRVIPSAGAEQLPGLEDVVSLHISYQGQHPKRMPSFLRENWWPKMAEIQLTNMTFWNSDLQALKLNMPNLQGLEIMGSELPFVPDFPWNRKAMELPRNLSRTRLTNDHYAVSQGIDIERHLFRRVLHLDENHIKNLSHIRIQGQLDRISFFNSQLDHLHNDTFTDVEGLQSLVLSFNQLVHLPTGVFRGLSSLRILDLSHNHLTSISKNDFVGLSKLTVLSLNNNSIVKLESDLFSPLQSIRILDLKDNNIREIAHDAITSDLHKLSNVTLANNNITHFPEWVFGTRSLTDIDLSNNHLTFDTLVTDLDDFSPSLLLFQNTESASSSSRSYKPKHVKTVDLRQNFFSAMNYTKVNQTRHRRILFKFLLTFFRLNIQENDINCDCSTFTLHKYLKEERLKPFLHDYSKPRVLSYYFHFWQCSKPEDVKNIPIVAAEEKAFTCPVDVEHCPRPCDCIQRIFDQSIIVNCSARNISYLPEALPSGTDTLILSKNSLTSIDNTPYFRFLKKLDLSQNAINSISDAAVASFDSISVVFLHDNALQYFPHAFTRLRQVELTLRGNILLCDCHSRWVIQWFITYHSRILDVERVICVSGEPESQAVLQADESQFFCKITTETMRLIAILMGVALFIIVILTLVTYKFRGEIKVFLYFHFKWHPFDRSDDSDIVDKLYDAFVSYNQEDTEWVMETLRPALETLERPYRLCIHERDFAPGGLITDNVLYSVKYSRRMIMVLTHSFLRSEWCRLEFKSAHHRVLKDRSNYLIVILLDDIDPSELDEDMKLYLRTNTYIDGNSHWFWQRLFYAMPERPLALLRGCTLPVDGFEHLFPRPESLNMLQSQQNGSIQRTGIANPTLVRA